MVSETGGTSADTTPAHTAGETRPTADGIELFNLAKVPITRYRYRGTKIPNPWVANHA